MVNRHSSNTNDQTRSGLSRGLDVLEHLAGNREGLSLGEITRRLDMSKSGTHGVLSILAKRGFVERLPGGIYRLGLKAWHVGNGMPEAEVSRLAEPIMERLVQETGEGAILGVLTVIGLFVLRRRQPDLPRPYRAWGYPVVPGLFVAVAVSFLLWMPVADPRNTGLGLLLTAAGVPAYLFWRRPVKSHDPLT